VALQSSARGNSLSGSRLFRPLPSTSILRQAILLVGPTGSGKTPLGQWLESHGLWGRSCHHFDFGANLREIASGGAFGFTAEEVLFVQDVVERGALLENERFQLALKVLEAFSSSRRLQPNDLLVMNGLPRHIGQAHAIAPHLRFAAIIDLRCDAETVWERLHRNAGGDRTNRTDDTVALVRQKLEVFAARTEPLLGFYEQRGVPLIRFKVSSHTLPSEIALVTEARALSRTSLD
jgi:adenylate kinase